VGVVIADGVLVLLVLGLLGLTAALYWPRKDP
jgi:hypothetical protein